MSTPLERVTAVIERMVRDAMPIYDWDAEEIAKAAIDAMVEPDRSVYLGAAGATFGGDMPILMGSSLSYGIAGPPALTGGEFHAEMFSGGALPLTEDGSTDYGSVAASSYPRSRLTSATDTDGAQDPFNDDAE